MSIILLLQLKNKYQYTYKQLLSIIYIKYTIFLFFLQEKKTDILGINYKHYLKTKNDDEDYFSKTKIKIKVNISINKPGLTVRRVTNEY